MSFTNPRRKNARFYWAELGFLALGLIGINPNILSFLLGGPVPTQTAPAKPLIQTSASLNTASPYPSTNTYNSHSYYGSTTAGQQQQYPPPQYPYSQPSSPYPVVYVVPGPSYGAQNVPAGYDNNDLAEAFSKSLWQWWGTVQAASQAPRFASTNTTPSSTVPPVDYSQQYQQQYNSQYNANYVSQQQPLYTQQPPANSGANSQLGANLIHGYDSNYPTIANQTQQQGTMGNYQAPNYSGSNYNNPSSYSPPNYNASLNPPGGALGSQRNASSGSLYRSNNQAPSEPGVTQRR